MTDLSLSLLATVFIVAAAVVFAFVGNHRRFRSEVRKRGISPGTIRDYEPDQGFLVIDYVYGGSIGIGSPIVWWSPPRHEDGIDFYSIRLVDLPAKERTIGSVKRRFPDKKIVESTTLPAPMTPAETEKVAM